MAPTHASSRFPHEFKLIIIGTGRFARSLALTMPDRLVGVIGRRQQQAESVASIATDAAAYASLEVAAELEADIIWLATADRALAEIAQTLAALRDDWSGKTFVHSSGASPLSLLQPLRMKGASVIALHPNVSLTGDEAIPSGLLWSVEYEGSDRNTIEGILHGLEPRIISIPEQTRPLYHAAASVASNFTTTLFALAEELYRRAGIPAEEAQSTVARFMAESVQRSLNLGAEDAVTGPVARNDIEILRRQLHSIETYAPEFIELFSHLIEATAALLRPEHLRAVRSLLDEVRNDQAPASGTPEAQSGQSTGE